MQFYRKLCWRNYKSLLTILLTARWKQKTLFGSEPLKSLKKRNCIPSSPKDEAVVEYAMSRNMSAAMISEHRTKLIRKEILQKKMANGNTNTFLYIAAAADMADAIYNVLHTTIKTIYPKYYPKEVADFFCQHHSKEHILDGIASGNMGVLTDGNVIVGTGCYDGNHITGVYVLPCYQKQGCGSRIMDCLEAEIVKKYDAAILDASLPAVCIYEHRGYKAVGHGIYELENDVKLVYEIMEKKLRIDQLRADST